MAQWRGQFSGRTHETKVQQLEDSIREAVKAWKFKDGIQQQGQYEVICRLCERLWSARLKALMARAVRLKEPRQKKSDPEHLTQLAAKIQEVKLAGVAGIIREFTGEGTETSAETSGDKSAT